MSRKTFTAEPVRAGDLVDARVDGLLAITYEQIHATYRRMGFAHGAPVGFDPERVFFMNDHNQPPKTLLHAQTNLYSRRTAARLQLANYRSEMGVCHQMMIDYGYVRPGEVVVGHD